MKRKAILVCVFIVWGFSPIITVAKPLFSMDITVDERQRSFSFDDVKEVFGQIEESQLRMAFSNYTDMSRASAMVDFRGLEMNFGFPGADASLVFEIPSLDVREEFKGATRDASVDQLEDFLKSEGGDILNRIQAASIAASPVDPIAGNPGSLMGTMVSGQFEAGFSSQVTNLATTPGVPASDGAPDTAAAVVEAESPDNLINVSPRFGRYTAGDHTSNVVNLPLGYSFRLREGGKGLRKIDVSLPLTYAEIEGGKSAAASLGAGLTYGLNDQWSLSPAIEVGVAGSVDLGAGGGIGSASLTSAYTIPFERYSLNVGNMVGYYKTLDIKVGRYRFDPGISNTVLSNGLMLSVPGTMWGRKLATEFWATDTRFFGDELYSEYNGEFGISLGTVKTEGYSIENYLRAGVSYMTGDNVKGWRFNLGYSF